MVFYMPLAAFILFLNLSVVQSFLCAKKGLACDGDEYGIRGVVHSSDECLQKCSGWNSNFKFFDYNPAFHQCFCGYTCDTMISASPHTSAYSIDGRGGVCANLRPSQQPTFAPTTAPTTPVIPIINHLTAVENTLLNPYLAFKDQNGNFYVSDVGVFKITPGNDVTTLISSTECKVLLWIDQNYLYYRSQDKTVKQIDLSNPSTVSVFGGGGQTVPSYGSPIALTSADLSYVGSMWGDGNGVFYISDGYNALIYKISGNQISAYAGGGSDVNSPQANTALHFTSLQQITGDAQGAIYAVDGGSHLIWKISSSTATIVGGKTGTTRNTDFTEGVSATSVALTSPAGVFVASNGHIYYSESGAGDSTVNYIDNDGNLHHYAGQYGVHGTYGQRDIGDVQGDGGPALNAELYCPGYLWGDSNGNIYIPDNEHLAIKYVNPVQRRALSNSLRG